MVHAEEYDEVLTGSLTQHVFNSNGVDRNFSNRINDNGLISNPLLGYRQLTIHGAEYETETIFGGQNSIGQPMFGYAQSVGLVTTGGLRFGFVYGLYMQDNDKMLQRHVVPVYIIPWPGWGPTPVLGGELTQTLNLSKSSYLMLNVLVTPLLLNGTIGIGWRI
jgi:hypothetical protein